MGGTERRSSLRGSLLSWRRFRTRAGRQHPCHLGNSPNGGRRLRRARRPGAHRVDAGVERLSGGFRVLHGREGVAPPRPRRECRNSSHCRRRPELGFQARSWGPRCAPSTSSSRRRSPALASATGTEHRHRCATAPRRRVAVPRSLESCFFSGKRERSRDRTVAAEWGCRGQTY